MFVEAYRVKQCGYKLPLTIHVAFTTSARPATSSCSGQAIHSPARSRMSQKKNRDAVGEPRPSTTTTMQSAPQDTPTAAASDAAAVSDDDTTDSKYYTTDESEEFYSADEDFHLTDDEPSWKPSHLQKNQMQATHFARTHMRTCTQQAVL